MLQPHFLAWTLNQGTAIFSSWQTFNEFEKQVTMKLKKKIVGIVNWNAPHVQYFQNSKEILMTLKRKGNCCLTGDGWYDTRDITLKT